MYLYRYLSTHGISGVAACGDCQWFEVRLNMTMEWTQRYTPRRWSSGFGDALGGWDRANSEMYLEAVIEQVERCAGRLWSSKFGDAIGHRDWVNSEMHWEGLIEWVPSCTLSPQSSKFADGHWGHDRASLEMQLKTEIEWIQRCPGTPRPSECGHALGCLDGVNSEMHSEQWSSEIREALAAGYGGDQSSTQSRGGRWVARPVLRLYSSVS